MCVCVCVSELLWGLVVCRLFFPSSLSLLLSALKHWQESCSHLHSFQQICQQLASQAENKGADHVHSGLSCCCRPCWSLLSFVFAGTCPVKTSINVCCWLVACSTPQQHASVSQGRICSDNFTCCHTEIEVADRTFHLAQSQYTDTGPTSPSADPVTPGTWQGSHWSANFEVTYECVQGVQTGMDQLLQPWRKGDSY